ncbi:MAG: hypothetical protein ACHBN1_28775 [Heteroscytonema crispum UTEX LB 1556]
MGAWLVGAWLIDRSKQQPTSNNKQKTTQRESSCNKRGNPSTALLTNNPTGEPVTCGGKPSRSTRFTNNQLTTINLRIFRPFY